MVIEQHQQNPSAVEPVAMDAKAEVAVQKPKKAGKKVKEPAAHVADGQKKVPKKSQNTHLAVSLPPQCSDSTNLKLYPVPSHHNSGPSTSRSQPVARQAQRPKTGSASTNGSQNGVQDKHVDGLSRSPPYGGNGDVRYMYSTTGPTRNLGPSSQRSKFAPPPGCLNSDKVGVPGEGTYLACGCVRCKEKSRSVFVPRFPNSAPLEEMLDTLKQMFGPFGAIERISPRQITSAFMRFFVVFESEESAVGAVKTLNGKLCGVGNRTVSVTHPFFSKYFVPIPQKSHGNGRTTSGPNSRRHSGESSQSRRAGLAEDRHSSALAQGQKHISSPQATEDRRNKENQGVPLPKDQPLTASQPLQDNRVEANHPVKKPSGTAKPNLIPCPPIELASHKVQPSLGSPLNVVNRMPSDPFMNQPNPNPAPTHHRTLHYGPPHALGPLPGSADRNQGSMSRRTVREFSGSTAGSNRPYQVSCPPQSDTSVTMGQMPPYPGYPVPMSQPFCQTAVPPAHPSFQGPYFQGQPMNHPGPHIHQPIHPGAPPMVVPGPYMFNSYMNPEGYGAVTAENCPPLGPDLQQMHSMHPSGPVWFNPAQPLYAPWGMPMPPYQGYPPHPMPGSCFPPTANEPPTCPPQPQYQGVLQSLPAAAEVPSNQTETPTQATTAELESETIRVRLPSTPPEATCKTADRSPELDLQPGASGLDELKTSEEGGPSTLPQELNRDENVDSDGATPSLDAAVAEREVDQATHMITKTTPTIAEEGLNGVQETILPDKESSGEGGAVSEVIGAEGETGNPEGILRDSQGQSNDAAESPSPPSSEASLPHELQPASIPRFVSQDIRLDPDFQAQMNTVVRRKPEHQTHWMTPHNSNVYSKPPGFGNHQASFSGPPESASYPVVIDYNNPFPHHAFHSPPVPPPMESSAEIHNLLYGDLFHPPPAFGSQPGNNDSVARKYNPVYEQQYGENGQPVGKTKQKKKNKAKNKKGAGSRPQTPSLPVEGDANPPAHGNSIRAQGDAAGQAHSGLGEVIFGVGNTDGTKANNMADGATAAETKKNGKKNKPNRDSQLSQGGNKPLEGSAACEGEELTAERRVQAKPEPQHVQTLGVNDSHTTLQGTEDKIGAVRVNKKTRGKGGVTRLESLFVPDDEKTKVMEVQTETGAESPRAPSKPEVSLHGSFKGLPKSFDPWPRRSGVSSPPSKKATLPKIVIQALKCENLAPTVSGDNPLTGTSESFFSAVSRLSSRENSPPGGEGVLIVNAEVDLERQPTPPFTPTKASPTSVTPARISTPSTATVNGDLSPPFPVAEKKVALGEDDDNNAAAPATETGTSEPSFIPVDQATAGPPGEAKTNGTKNKVKRKKNKKKQNSTQNGAGDKA
ncbi:hypothetical protein QBC34DRAFT_395396 [Podospora aff. communis PSN243]|uniref:RRM domain-containing protein n=1 Tax=Podospora aff. communis PSN243 TaxID=3040156 RepID=A0AAV9GZJ4_9PEZI|nr:hypothetical protein QBC34DRAFT_395396 [Podospora aff. communis PSN243]